MLLASYLLKKFHFKEIFHDNSCEKYIWKHRQLILQRDSIVIRALAFDVGVLGFESQLVESYQ